jgi:hypothetical protein
MPAMTDKPAYVRLAQLEAQRFRDNISLADYNEAKWPILQEILSTRETVNPVYKGERQKEIKDLLENQFCYLPPSVFIYGNDNVRAESKAGLYMAKYPVTVNQFVVFVEHSGWDYPKEELDIMWEVSPEWDCPVSNISWNDADAYCRWLRRESEEYYDLPLEVEWEYAARGIDGRTYPWGYDQPYSDRACYVDQEHEPYNTVVINKFEENVSPFGCMDMAGNVWEFCRDKFDDEREPRCLRGGSWCHPINCLQSSFKIFSHPPTKRVDYSGFRLIYVPDDMLDEYKRQYGID